MKVLDEVNTFITKEDLVSVSIDADTVLGDINQLQPRKSDGNLSCFVCTAHFGR